MPVLAEEKKWTYADYLKLEDDKRYEVIRGILYMTPAPDFNHQYVSSGLFFLMKKFVEEKALGYLISAPTDVILDDSNIVQPDILFIAKANKGIIQKRGVFGPPDIVVEIVSPSSQYRDVYEKKDLYERHGIREFWVVNPYMKSIEVLVLSDSGAYGLYSEGSLEGNGEQIAKSRGLEGFEVDLKEVFRESF